jgi:thiamine-phosphate pyrophosphorylase
MLAPPDRGLVGRMQRAHSGLRESFPMTLPANERRERLRCARLYLVCGARPGGRDAAPLLAAALAGGVHVVQLREKDAPGDLLLEAAEVFRAACDAAGALFILNDRPELAGPARADGVHLGQDDMPVAEARELLGEGPIIGLSTHTPAQVDRATGVDYIGVGPVHATPTKPGRPAVGTELVRHAAAHATIPFFAIGGIDAQNCAAVVAAGARRIAVMRAITEAPDPEATTRALRSSVDSTWEATVGAA